MGVLGEMRTLQGGLPFIASAIQNDRTPRETGNGDGREFATSVTVDLIGEFFCLEALRPDNPYEDNAWMTEAAWRAGAGSMADSVFRAKQNFPNHPAIARIDITVKGVGASWFAKAIGIVRGANDLAQGLQEMARWLLPTHVQMRPRHLLCYHHGDGDF